MCLIGLTSHGFDIEPGASGYDFVSVFFFSFLGGLTGMYTSVLAVYFS